MRRPRSIYALLDRNNLTALYAPVVRGSGTLVADNRDPSASRPRARLTDVARSQSPDTDEPDRRRAAVEKGDVLLPHYSLLGIKDPVAPGDAARAPRGLRRTTRRVAWHPNHTAAPGRNPPPNRPRPIGHLPPTAMSRRPRPRRPRRPTRAPRPRRRPPPGPAGGRSTRRTSQDMGSQGTT